MFRASLPLALALLSALSSLNAAAQNVLILKTGEYRLSDTDQVLLGRDIDYEASVRPLINLEYQWRFKNQLSVGADLLAFDDDYLFSSRAPGTLEAYLLSANVKKFFTVTPWLHPYVGVGAGQLVVDLQGPVQGGIDGYGLHANAGIELRIKRLGVYAEYKQLNAQAKDADNERITLSGRGLLFGAGLHF